MKTEVIIEETERRFPLLARGQDGEVVLFLNSVTGTVVKDSKTFNIGHCSGMWVDVLNNPHYWTILPPGSKVILTQE